MCCVFAVTPSFHSSSFKWLFVAGGGRVHGGAEQLFKMRVADGFFGEFADAAAGKDFFHDWVTPFFDDYPIRYMRGNQGETDHGLTCVNSA